MLKNVQDASEKKEMLNDQKFYRDWLQFVGDSVVNGSFEQE